MNLSVSTALHRFWLAAALPSASLLSLCLACTETSPPASADPPGPAGVQDLSVAADLTPPPPPPPDLMPPPTPMVLTGSFDAGSSPFRSWVATMEFAREIQATYKKPLRLTYFVTTAFYDTTVTGSAVGRAASRDEVLVRWALTQQALNEGHEVANHTVRHQDGGMWTAAQWRAELKEYQDLLQKNLFQPVLDERGQPVFPKWAPAPGAAAGAVGAACTDSKQCTSGRCAMVTASQGFCTRECNADTACPSGTFCGFPDETGTELYGIDICLPRPAFPILHQGQELFRSDGTPNLGHPALRPYQPVGFRAPLLETNDAMYEVLKEMGYTYDSSQVDEPDAPYRYKGVLELSLMKFADSLAIPMDYNYMVHMDTDGMIMDKDYRRSILACYNDRANPKMTWHIGHHLRAYGNGVYFETFKRVFRFAAQGCPDDKGALRCPYMEFPTMGEFTRRYTKAPLLPLVERTPPSLRGPRRADRPSCGPH